MAHHLPNSWRLKSFYNACLLLSKAFYAAITVRELVARTRLYYQSSRIGKEGVIFHSVDNVLEAELCRLTNVLASQILQQTNRGSLSSALGPPALQLTPPWQFVGFGEGRRSRCRRCPYPLIMPCNRAMSVAALASVQGTNWLPR